ncbi:tripartite tricarboxylate transporter permease [Brooklawnia cerclae]|uniref:Tricarboxylic transport membrane protein n=1 Tax=Brooklawnia cerclae TaxID=349934 RepID=A0ABX0SK55_9ACTN|nr:tripartite tricarboxylate transporter permease [Brooklawnia cerclae]NIH58366.1 putative tricarboxylic transport membrane protein [Brooklawnia cerclae]
MLENILLGFQTSLTPENLLWCLIGVVLGTVIGMLPGLGATTGVAILLPLTLSMDPVTALIMLAGIYYGCQYGGTIAAVLIATPGDANAVATVIDGYALARKGQAGKALAIAAIGSFVAAIISLVLLCLVAAPIATFALKFGPAEMLAIMIMGLLTIISFSGENLAKGLMMAGVGLFLSTVGMSSGFAKSRFTFGSVNLLGGIDFVVVMIGVFAIGEVVSQIGAGGVQPIRTRMRDMVIRRKDIQESLPSILRGTGVGFLLGCLPGAGSTLAALVSYGVEKQVSPFKANFGHGAIQGVAAAESANNAAANANFVPTLALGVPGGTTTAVLLGAFVMYGVQPGPLLFQNQPALVWGLLTSFFIGNVILLVLNLPLAPAFAQVLRLNYAFLYPAILFFSLIGAFAVGNNSFALIVVLAAGVAGFFLKKYDYPTAPLILGLVLGPMAEKALVQTSSYANGDLSVIFTEPIALAILVLTVAIMAVPSLVKRIASAGKKRGDAGIGASSGTPDAPVAESDAAAPDPEAGISSATAGGSERATSTASSRAMPD